MSASPRDPLAGVGLLLIDGTNLLHALRHGSEPAPGAAVIGRLRAAIPPAVRIELVFDGPPDRGAADRRIAAGITVRWAGRRSADAVLLDLVAATPAASVGDRPHVLVVSDDAELRRALRDRGAATARTGWLISRLDRPRLASPAAGRSRPPAVPANATSEESGTPERPGWRPGRGATVKRGNPHRASRHGSPGSGRAPGPDRR